MIMLPVPITPVTPMRLPRLIPMPVFYANRQLSLLANLFFPDDDVMARKFTAQLLAGDFLQKVLGAGIQIDNRYMTDIINDVRDGQPDRCRVAKRRYQVSAVGQITKTLFALINSPDPMVRQHATWEQAMRIAGKEIGHARTSKRESFDLYLRRFRRVLHIAAAFELEREETARHPMTADGLMLNAMTLHQRLWAWHTQRSFPPRVPPSDLLSEIYWMWPQGSYADHGVADVGIRFERLISHGQGGRPRKN
jgi:hypothetical protein